MRLVGKSVKFIQPILSDMQDVFGDIILRRGREYVVDNRLFDLKSCPSGCHISGRVRGSKSRPYIVGVELNLTAISIGDMQCTCPYGFGCKHAAALLISYFGLDVVSGDASTRSTELPRHLMPDLTRLKLSLGGIIPGYTEPPLLYVFKANPGRLGVDVRVPSKKKNGGVGLGKLLKVDRLQYKDTLIAEDQAIVDLWCNGLGYPNYNGLPENADISAALVKKLVATGRSHWMHPDNPPLKSGKPCVGRLDWVEQPDGRQKLQLVLDETNKLSFVSPCPLYVDTANWEVGEIELPFAPKAVKAAMQVPAISVDEAEALPLWLEKNAPQIPRPRTKYPTERRIITPKPRLWLETKQVQVPMPGGEIGKTPLDLAVVSFDYPKHVIDPKAHQHTFVEGDTRVIETCDTAKEKQCFDELAALGFEKIENPAAYGLKGAAAYMRGDAGSWTQLLQNKEAMEKEKDWAISTSPTFRLQIVEADDEWDSQVQQGSGWWLSLNMGVNVEGERVPLLPLLRQGLQSLPGEPSIDDIDGLSANGKFVAQLPDGRLLTLPFERVKPIFQTLFELLADADVNGETINLSIAHAAQLMKLMSADEILWQGTARLMDLAKRLTNFKGIETVVAPESFEATLRSYQQDGLSWLQFLREFDLGGILADDMGLGKTVQALAHILLEKKSGRLQAPFLVVCPTSVVPNWVNEARRFAPELQVLALQGADRAQNFHRLEEADLVISTYPLLLRDADVLVPVEWHGVILDEAQAIKNCETQITQVAYNLNAHHKICMTGTPIENHLGELWSQFMFLMPGMLGGKKTFTKQFRTPIEKHRDISRQKLLSTRLAPFILRRTKTEVAEELPEKTTIIQRIQIEGAQRDLYETVRLAMQRAVRDEIAAKGIGRSTIMILDALLKLRQVCCDPRLLKISTAKNIRESAKLSALMEMLPELVEEGRRIIVFSQFTSMLDLIRAEVSTLNIPFVELRGDTKDRKMPVSKFQQGEVPLFLISLKAGGTGLNLTAADTVIHYDPWWNPAVEDQATDRAHRIGQTKNVFVYKLIAEGTLEERMLQLQERKRDIANALFDPERSASIRFTEEDLDLLFKPLE